LRENAGLSFMHEFLQELRAPIAFAVVAAAVWVSKTLAKSALREHTEMLQNEIRDHTSRIRDLEKQVSAAWRKIERQGGCYVDHTEEE